jgi:hypothetical protein
MKKKYYGNIKSVLDDALDGYALKGGIFAKGAKKVKEGKHVFAHLTEFPCVKQPSGSQKEAFYALHHLKGFIQDQQLLTLPANLRKWAQDLATITDDDIREYFFRTQTQFSEIIKEDVITKGGNLLLPRPTFEKSRDRRTPRNAG